MKERIQVEEHTRLDRGQHRRDTREFRVEVASIRSALDLWEERWLHALVVNVVPVDVAEKGLAHDLLRVRGATSQPLVGLTGKQLLQDRHRVSRHVDRVERLVRQNGVVDFVFILTSEGRLLQQHLVNQDTKRPPVDRTAILLIQQNLLWVSQVISCRLNLEIKKIHIPQVP